MSHKLLRTKPVQTLLADTQDEHHSLKKSLRAVDLVAIGIGCIIGVGIFVLPGVQAAKNAGPGIILSFAIAAAACACSALCYAELAAMIPVAGSAYTYGYATLGEIFAWIIGWDLILEYMVAAILVSTGWSAYFVNMLSTGADIHLPTAYTASPWDKPPGLFNLPAVAIVLLLTFLLVRGIKESSRVNLFIVILKIAVILFFILLTVWHVDPAKWSPFMPFGFTGVMTAAAIVFLAFVGFDAVSTTAEEAINPQRDMPIGIMGSLAVATLLYMAVAAIMTGIVPYKELGVADPVALVLNRLDMPWASALVSVGAIAGITSVLLVLLMGQPRILFAMSRDGLLPPFLSNVHQRFKTPWVTTLITGGIVAVFAALTPIDVSSELCSIGTLFAFIIVCAGVLVLRYTRKDLPRPFRVPLFPVLPALGIVLCAYLMLSLPLVTWWRFLGWMGLGLLIYFLYSFHSSRLNREGAAAAPKPR
ncbi:MAG TPA: amino acid permease [Acidobacteriota bacterium]|nr:amino acid permease [Acidobacteriota bacterium]HNR38641.1 amino acid permease [Acidobacteriota bacterium]HNU01112.1 amino acid permease [Acidobacteriota bacterium]HPB27611.1 amino acid permease [Acidobacteriota bacterium]HQO25205.1 amino acid permease [Acidobacteriota bacterium]